MCNGRCRATLILSLCMTFTAHAAGAQQSGAKSALTEQDTEYYDQLVADQRNVRQQDFLARVMSVNRMLPRRKRVRRKLDLTPLADMAIAYLKDRGLPIIEKRDEKKRPIAVSAEFSVAADTPNVKLHLGDRPAEPMGAFYPPEKGFRFSVIYPMENFSFRLEGGEDSEFGSLAVLGMSWVHPSKRYALGFGLPMKIKNAEGDFGAIMQFRMNLD